ncbi:MULTISPECIES: DMT family transporter [Reinekea]|uniref:Permease of the drug/metabolite transporter (DMT) superfamily n=2 Tax=Reinekea TaxID=230494 RepID=A0A2K8KJG5_9GAMM|nr:MULTISPECIES: DMT family transporter [Reinekea]ATX75208.1 permease of the drug/metabolite transporter (DMT) superfamily [Reinekea forsetii]MDO7644785.1 DMT family transporter [Reinekea forsetii]
MVIIGYISALAAALCWALSSLLAISPVRTLGAIPFNALRMTSVALLLSLWLLLSQRWHWPEPDVLWTLMASGFIGIFLGDTLLFVSMRILGPRLAGLLFACNAPISFALGLWLLGESYYWLNLLGVGATTVGVFFAIASRTKTGGHQWEQSMGHVGLGLMAGLGAALCQSLGTLIVFDTLRAGQDPVFATLIRVAVAVVFLLLSLLVRGMSGTVLPYRVLSSTMVGQTILSGLLGMAVGMSLLLYAVKLAPLGTVAILSATTPVMVLPALWLTTRRRPSAAAFVSAIVVFLGTAMIFIAA